jgi:hypothetical protein
MISYFGKRCAYFFGNSFGILAVRDKKSLLRTSWSDI